MATEKQQGALDRFASVGAELVGDEVKGRLDLQADRLQSKAKEIRPKVSLQDKVKKRVADQMDRRAKTIKKGGSDEISDKLTAWLEEHRILAILAAAVLLAVLASQAQPPDDSE